MHQRTLTFQIDTQNQILSFDTTVNSRYVIIVRKKNHYLYIKFLIKGKNEDSLYQYMSTWRWPRLILNAISFWSDPTIRAHINTWKRKSGISLS